MSLADIQRWEPEQIDEVSEAAAQRARTSGEQAQALRNLQVFSTWKGEAGEAAKQAIERSATKLDMTAKESFLVSLGAQKSAQDARTVKNDLNSILQDAAASPAVTVDTATNTVIPPDTTGWEESEVQALVDKIEDLENRIVAVLASAEETDADLARVLTAATGGDPATPAEQGAADGTSLQDGRLTPEESARLAENTTLTPEQLAALQRGNLVLPASQMEYLHQLSRSLDGKSTPEIRALMDKLGTDGARLQDALQMVSNEHISATGINPSLKPGDKGYVPARGSFDALPDAVRRDLTKFPLNFQETNVGAGVYPQARQELRDLAAMVDKGNPALQQGSTFDQRMLKQAEIMLDNSKVPPDAVPLVKGQVDPVLQDMLSAAGRDQMAVYDALAGEGSKPPNDKFIENLLTHQWADGGAAAGSLLHGTAPVANPTDLTDPTQLAQATRAGETLNAVDGWAGNSENVPKLLNIAGTDGQSLGQVNPELAKALAEANKPYLDDMMSNNLDNTRGFDALDNPREDAGLTNTRGLFSVIDTNEDAAATLNSQAYLNSLQYQHNFEQSIIDGGNVDTGDLQSAGTQRGVIDAAANVAANDAISDANAAAQKAHENKGQWLDIAKSLGGEIPGVKAILDGIDKMPGDTLRDMVVGEAPNPNAPNPVTMGSSDALQYSIAQHLLDNHIGDPSVFEEYGLIDSATGQLKPLDAPDVNPANFSSAFTNYFDGIDPSVKFGIEDYEDGYRDALPKPPGGSGK